jgi:CheY-like chemotaxis protein
MRNRVLVVEDNDVMREIMLRQLRSCDVNCYAVTRAEEAVELAEFFDLILMDVELPGMSGIEATRVIRRKEQSRRWQPVPIIATTCTDRKAECLSAGMNAFCPKPVLRDDVEAILEQWLYGKPPRLRLLG